MFSFFIVLNKRFIKNVVLSALRKVIEQYSSESLPSVPSDIEKKRYGSIHVSKTGNLFDMIHDFDAVESENPMTMESVGQVCEIICLYLATIFVYSCSWCSSDLSIFLLYIPMHNLFINFFIIQMFGFLLYVTEYAAKDYDSGNIVSIPKVLQPSLILQLS